MNPLLFGLFAFLMLAFGVSVVVNRNPVASALSLVVSFLCLAALYVGLDAYLIGSVQVVVYAGAVMEEAHPCRLVRLRSSSLDFSLLQ